MNENYRILLQARKALRALKGLVKLQALVRGYLVRKCAAETFHSMQALIRAQTSVRSQRINRNNILHPRHSLVRRTIHSIILLSILSYLVKLMFLVYNRRNLMIREAISIAREYQSLSRNIATTTRTMRPVPRLLRLTLTRQSQDRGD